jgi:hypothetical protein
MAEVISRASERLWPLRARDGSRSVMLPLQLMRSHFPNISISAALNSAGFSSMTK